MSMPINTSSHTKKLVSSTSQEDLHSRLEIKVEKDLKTKLVETANSHHERGQDLLLCLQENLARLEDRCFRLGFMVSEIKSLTKKSNF